MTEENVRYDGFHFLPDPQSEDSYMMQFFTLERKDGDQTENEPLGSTDVGDLFNVLLMRQKENGIEVTDIFQAIFADPVVYAEGLIGSDHYGTFVRHTELAKDWWNLYVQKTQDTVKIFNMTGEVNVGSEE